ncbi:hypothetical protein KC316_g6526 [Hortaea werneckii]|nr:hypothetical protein KC324_g6601 [Hortaea werneckii]KAI7584738.1 hypothetical protein KC316_g6526 [Hortaea werneckii]
MSFSSSNTFSTNFPPELDLGTVKAPFGICALRRHVLDNLQSMNLTQTPTNFIDTHDQTGGDHGHAVRQQARMNLFEGRYYARKPQEVIALCWPYSALLAECSWNCTKPMDFRTFQALCNGQVRRRHRLRTEIVIELFPRDDFINPPPELDDPEATSLLLTRTQQNNPGYSTFDFRHADETVYSGLVSVWKRQLKHLPSWVEKVHVIRKSPHVPHLAIQVHSIRQDSHVELFNLLKDIDGNGKDVLGTLIAQGIPITI